MVQKTPEENAGGQGMRNFHLELIYENAGGETYTMPIGNGLFLGAMMIILIVIAVVAAVLVSILFTSQGIRKMKGMRQKEELCFQSVQECRMTPSAAPVGTGTGMPGETGRISMGETTILGGEWIPPAGTLWRKKTGEKIRIRKSVFSIGKDFQEADYAVKDNPLISRLHAVFRCQYGSYYIEDNNSANGTFVNERRLALGQEACLKSGDRIRIADEEFEFYM